MAEAIDLILFIDSDSSDNNKRLEPTFIPDYRNFAFTKSELHLLYDEVIEELEELLKENGIDEDGLSEFSLQNEEARFLENKLKTTHYFVEVIVPEAEAMLAGARAKNYDALEINL